MTYKQERQFSWLFAFVFSLIAFWPVWPLQAPDLRWLSGAGVWLVAGAFVPSWLSPLYRAWIKLGHALGWINSRIILGAVFYLMMTPIGLILRMFGKDPLHRKIGAREPYWIKRDHAITPDSLKNQF